MGLNIILLFFTFSSLTLLTLFIKDRRRSFVSRTKEEWVVDGAGLFIQGIVIPAFPFLIVPILGNILPDLEKSIDLHPVIQFLISFVLIDYIYYWNHRMFHRKNFWEIHRLHHSIRNLDVFASSRNSLITSFLFVYVWAQILGLFLLRESSPYMLGLALTFALDLWRHSGMNQPHALQSLLSPLLIFPEQHVLHHSIAGRNKNYGANFNLWDKLHGTYSAEIIPNQELDKLSQRNVWQEIIFPWKRS